MECHEAQTIPVSRLKPCLAALTVLVEQHGCSVVVTSTNQQALLYRPNFSIGLKQVREIITNPQTLQARINRVQIKNAGPLATEELTTRLLTEKQCLVIVNNQAHALALYHALQTRQLKKSCFYLSTSLCPEHRNSVISHMKQLLKTDQNCHLIATSLVEVGSDLDFPQVYRSLAGLDAIAQAAGHCNREGTRPHLGTTWLFHPKEPRFANQGTLQQAANHSQQVMALPTYANQILSPQAMQHYFSLHYWQQEGETGEKWDKQRVMECFNAGNSVQEPFHFQYQTAAETFQWITEPQQPVIIPWDQTAKKIIQKLKTNPQPSASVLTQTYRALQRYIVTIPTQLCHNLDIEILHKQFYIVLNPQRNYCQQRGIITTMADSCDHDSALYNDLSHH